MRRCQTKNSKETVNSRNERITSIKDHLGRDFPRFFSAGRPAKHQNWICLQISFRWSQELNLQQNSPDEKLLESNSQWNVTASRDPSRASSYLWNPPIFWDDLSRKISNCMVKGCGFPFKDSHAVSSTLRDSIRGFCVYCIAERMCSLLRGNFTTSNQPHQGLWRASLLSLQLMLVVTILGLHLLAGKPL